jgi:galactokinase
LDQLAILFAEQRRAQLIDFRDISVRSVPFEPENDGATLLLINSHAEHQHAGGEYADRRASCERAAAAMGVPTLRELQDLGPQVLTALPDSEDGRRARHILTENQRVLDTVAALQRSDFAEVGRLLTTSQKSMRDDFGITTDHIDLIAETAVLAGALGARMTGGGFGGCVIALVPTERSGAVEDAVHAAMRRHGHREPTIVATHAGHGAGGWPRWHSTSSPCTAAGVRCAG